MESCEKKARRWPTQGLGSPFLVPWILWGFFRPAISPLSSTARMTLAKTSFRVITYSNYKVRYKWIIATLLTKMLEFVRSRQLDSGWIIVVSSWFLKESYTMQRWFWSHRAVFKNSKWRVCALPLRFQASKIACDGGARCQQSVIESALSRVWIKNQVKFTKLESLLSYTTYCSYYSSCRR